jgi:hypothetical protein
VQAKGCQTLHELLDLVVVRQLPVLALLLQPANIHVSWGKRSHGQVIARACAMAEVHTRRTAYLENQASRAPCTRTFTTCFFVSDTAVRLCR